MTKPAKPDPIAAIGRPSLPWLWLAALLLVGLLARLGLAELGRRHAYVMDHMCNVSWGASMERYGLASAYGLGVQNLEKIRIDSDQVAPELRDSVRPVVAPNHPPLMMAGYLLEYKLLSAIQGDGRNVLANTLAARLCFAVVPTVCDMILAIACGLLAAQLYGRRAGLIAGGIVWLAPPIMLNSAYWGQVDSVLMAPAVVMVLLMLRNRWLWAGVALGLGAMLKPQAVLLVPAAVFAAAVLQSAAGRPAWSHVTARLGKLSASAAAVIVIISLPWTVAQGSRWVQRSYLDNFTQLYPQTTAMAFNVWYADALRLDSTPGESLDEDAQILAADRSFPEAPHRLGRERRFRNLGRDDRLVFHLGIPLRGARDLCN